MEKLVITADHRHFRVLREDPTPMKSGPALRLVDEMEFTEGRGGYTGRESDMAGRFPSSPGSNTGMSIDERLTMQKEFDRRIAQQIADRIEDCLGKSPRAVWCFAAGPEIHNAVLERIQNGAKKRLVQSIVKEVSKVPPNELLRYFKKPVA